MAEGRSKNLPEDLELQRTMVLCNSMHPIIRRHFNTLVHMRVDNSLTMKQLQKDFKIEVKLLTDKDMGFDMIGVAPSIANAFWRILIAHYKLVFRRFPRWLLIERLKRTQYI